MSLPSGYTQLKYIESTGTQYVDTGLVPTANTRVLMDFQLMVAGTGNRCLFGVAGQFSFRWLGSGSVFRSNGSNSANFSTGISGTDRHVVDKTATTTNLDGTYTVTTTVGTVSLSLYLFAQHAASTTTNYSSSKIYSCKIYEGNNAVRDFVPCINADGVIGLWDDINSAFYSNAGTGVFLAGPKKVKLPSGYTQVEYIQSSGTQYIDTGFNPTFATRVKMECEPLVQTDDNACLFGARAAKSATASNMFVVWTMSAGATVRSDYFGTNATGSTSITGQRVSIDKNRNVYTDGYNALTNTAKTSGTCAYPLYVFCLNNVGMAEYYKASQLSFLQIYDADVLVRDFIPCKNSSGTIGLFDVVGQIFYGNKGTGEFTSGEEVVWPSDSGVIYVKINGEWKQVTEITVNIQ